jgi:glucose-6-phosphate 1-dehydrogenase
MTVPQSSGPNPLLDGLRIEPTPAPTALIIFGASGDLTRRKLLPALYHLSRAQRLPARFTVVGVARSEMTDDQFRHQLHDSLKEFAGLARPDDVSSTLAKRMFYVQGEMDDPGLYKTLTAKLKECGAPDGVLFYFAIPPTAYGTVADQLAAATLFEPGSPDGWRRLIVEKPFGTDLDSARALNQRLHKYLDESQIFRIDHYLGKETVQNLLVFRFANGMFEPVWNRRYIDHVQITAAETVGVERRAAYYEEAGALRDMVQNHLMQVLALVAMEPPTTFSAENVRDRKLDVVVSMQPFVNDAGDPDHVVRGRIRLAGERRVGARLPPEDRVNPASKTGPTSRCGPISTAGAGRACRFTQDERRLPKRTTEIAIQFRKPPLHVFGRVSPTPISPNLLIVNVQPDEGISVRFEAKLPGTRMQLAPVMMNFRYGSAFGRPVPEAYETLLLDAMLGDATLFARHDFVEASWALITPIHRAWARLQDGLTMYEAGEWGPREADALIGADGRRWRTL